MTRLIYVGAHDAVLVPLPAGGEAIVKRDELLDTTADHAASLLDQPLNWQPAPKHTKKEDE